jgi:imidazolonepropionase-like amidohydrolase
MKLDALLPVIRKELAIKAHAHRLDDIFTAIRIAKEFDIDITLDHCTEAHLCPQRLAKEKCGFFVGPSFGSRSKYELKEKTFDTPRMMYEAGIEFGIITDAPIVPLSYLGLCAGLAVKAGLPQEIAWKAITINPARIIGIADKVGSLKAGKDADIILFRGNPLTDIGYRTAMTIINGNIVYTDGTIKIIH